MKKSTLTICAIFLLVSCNQRFHEKSMDEIVDEGLQFSFEQSIRLAEQCIDKDSLLPRTYEKGQVITVESQDWTSGFFPGTLWYLYEYSNDTIMRSFAQEYTSRIEREKYTTNNHDIGFILNCSFGNGFRLTGDTVYREVLLTGARSLSTRFNPNVGLIRSWDFNESIWQYPVIIDNMMNLELLLWASEESGDNSFKNMAISHANKTMKNHYRPDYSCYHVVSYDTISSQPEIKQTFQGYSNESSWARGQAWGLYGFTMMYRETGDTSYLKQSRHIASFLIYHPNMPEDYIPYWDFNAPNISNSPRDASAAAVMASALIELSGYVDKKLSALYLEVAEKQIRTLASSQYTARPGENGNFILKHSVGFLPQDSEVDVPLNYADYYYVEALMRLKKLLTKPS